MDKELCIKMLDMIKQFHDDVIEQQNKHLLNLEHAVSALKRGDSELAQKWLSFDNTAPIINDLVSCGQHFTDDLRNLIHKYEVREESFTY
jgi:hypothetical protein